MWHRSCVLRCFRNVAWILVSGIVVPSCGWRPTSDSKQAPAFAGNDGIRPEDRFELSNKELLVAPTLHLGNRLIKVQIITDADTSVSSEEAAADSGSDKNLLIRRGDHLRAQEPVASSVAGSSNSDLLSTPATTPVTRSTTLSGREHVTYSGMGINPSLSGQQLLVSSGMHGSVDVPEQGSEKSQEKMDALVGHEKQYCSKLLGVLLNQLQHELNLRYKMAKSKSLPDDAGTSKIEDNHKKSFFLDKDMKAIMDRFKVECGHGVNMSLSLNLEPATTVAENPTKSPSGQTPEISYDFRGSPASSEVNSASGLAIQAEGPVKSSTDLRNSSSAEGSIIAMYPTLLKNAKGTFPQNILTLLTRRHSLVNEGGPAADTSTKDSKVQSVNGRAAGTSFDTDFGLDSALDSMASASQKQQGPLYRISRRQKKPRKSNAEKMDKQKRKQQQDTIFASSHATHNDQPHALPTSATPEQTTSVPSSLLPSTSSAKASPSLLDNKVFPVAIVKNLKSGDGSLVLYPRADPPLSILYSPKFGKQLLHELSQQMLLRRFGSDGRGTTRSSTIDDQDEDVAETWDLHQHVDYKLGARDSARGSSNIATTAHAMMGEDGGQKRDRTSGKRESKYNTHIIREDPPTPSPAGHGYGHVTKKCNSQLQLCTAGTGKAKATREQHHQKSIEQHVSSKFVSKKPHEGGKQEMPKDVGKVQLADSPSREIKVVSNHMPIYGIVVRHEQSTTHKHSSSTLKKVANSLPAVPGSARTPVPATAGNYKGRGREEAKLIADILAEDDGEVAYVQKTFSKKREALEHPDNDVAAMASMTTSSPIQMTETSVMSKSNVAETATTPTIWSEGLQSAPAEYNLKAENHIKLYKHQISRKKREKVLAASPSLVRRKRSLVPVFLSQHGRAPAVVQKVLSGLTSQGASSEELSPQNIGVAGHRENPTTQRTIVGKVDGSDTTSKDPDFRSQGNEEAILYVLRPAALESPSSYHLPPRPPFGQESLGLRENSPADPQPRLLAQHPAAPSSVRVPLDSPTIQRGMTLFPDETQHTASSLVEKARGDGGSENHRTPSYSQSIQKQDVPLKGAEASQMVTPDGDELSLLMDQCRLQKSILDMLQSAVTANGTNTSNLEVSTLTEILKRQQELIELKEKEKQMRIPLGAANSKMNISSMMRRDSPSPRRDTAAEKSIKVYSHVKRRQQTLMMNVIARLADAVDRSADILSADKDKAPTNDGGQANRLQRTRQLVKRILRMQRTLLEFQHEKRLKSGREGSAQAGRQTQVESAASTNASSKRRREDQMQI